MDRWNHRWEEPRRFEHQDDQYTMGMVSQAPPQEQFYQDYRGYEYASHDSHNNLHFPNDHWGSDHGSNVFGAPPDFQPQAHEHEHNEPSLAELMIALTKSQARVDMKLQQRSTEIDQLMMKFQELSTKLINIKEILRNQPLEQDHELASCQSSEFSDPNPLLVHNDNIDVHSYGAEREDNVPLSHVVNNIVHHDFTLKEDGNREEENVLPGIGLEEVVIVDERSKEEDISPGGILGNLSLDEYEHIDYERRKHERFLSRGTSKNEEEMIISQEGEAMMARDPSLATYSSRKASSHVSPFTSEIVTSIVEENVPSKELVIDRGSETETESLTVNYPPDSTNIKPTLELSQQQKKKKQKKKKKGLMNQLSEIFKKADANVPLLNLIETVPAYAQFIKSLYLHKRIFADNEKFKLNEEVSAIIQHRLPQSKHEFGCFVTGCKIGDETFDGALMDLNTNINIMPLATYQMLAIGPLKQTSVSLQLADGATRLPVGIVEDVLIRVDKFILPADFVVLDMNEDFHMDLKCPIILGKPFMATAGVKINVQKGTVCLKVLGEKVKLHVFQPGYPEEVIEEVFAINLVKGNQAKSNRIFGSLNPPKPLDQDHHSVVVANHELQEFSSSDDDDMSHEPVDPYMHDGKISVASTFESKFDSFIVPLPVHKTEASLTSASPELDMDPHFLDSQTSSFGQVHKPVEFSSPPQQELGRPTATIHERDRGILPTPYIPPHRRMFLPTPFLHPHEHSLPSSFESFKMRSPPCSEVQLEAIQCLREILGIGVNRMKIHECYPSSYTSCKSMAAPYMNCFSGRQMCFVPP